jgi:antitoxin component of MazEF toxin-antitoxin module
VNKSKPKHHAKATVLSRVGNTGCIRFPLDIRKASGIKRDDLLGVEVVSKSSLKLRKLVRDEISAPAEHTASLKECKCDLPELCEARMREKVTVGWSYVKLNISLAEEFGFIEDQPIELTGENGVITVRIYRESSARRIPLVVCPP